jgi:hypothetical protein
MEPSLASARADIAARTATGRAVDRRPTLAASRHAAAASERVRTFGVHLLDTKIKFHSVARCVRHSTYCIQIHAVSRASYIRRAIDDDDDDDDTVALKTQPAL